MPSLDPDATDPNARKGSGVSKRKDDGKDNDDDNDDGRDPADPTTRKKKGEVLRSRKNDYTP